MKSNTTRVRISSSALLKPVPVAGFIVSEKNRVKTVSKTYHFRKPRVVKAKSGWYIIYYYRIPFHLKELYNQKEWLRFRIKEDINRRSGQDREEYAQWLLGQITRSLNNGYDPFQPDKEINEIAEEEIMTGHFNENETDISEGIEFFLQQWEKRGLEESSMNRYRRTANYLKAWFENKRMGHKTISEITSNQIESFLSDLKAERELSNREYNNQRDFTRTILNFFVKKKFLQDNLISDIAKLKTKSTKHRYYDSVSLEKIMRAMNAIDPYTLFAFQTVYYLCIRAEKELMNFKTENILWNENKILLGVGKGNAERYIPMDENIKEIFLKRKINEYPTGYYVFGVHEEPSVDPFGRGFFSKRFRKIRTLAGLPDVYTLYSAKHTRVIHLKKDNLSDADIMSLTGHKDFSAYAKYLRDLGLEADPKNINRVSRTL